MTTGQSFGLNVKRELQVPKLIEQFSCLTVSPWDLLALQGKKVLRTEETAAWSNVERQM